MQLRREHIGRIISMVALLVSAFKSQAQSGSVATAQQAVQLGMSNVAEISFVNSSAVVDLIFDDMNDYANGVESAEQTIRVRSNKNYDVRVKANAPKFTYSGTSTNPHMSVSNVLDLKVTANSTGGNIVNGFSGFKSLGTANRKIISNGVAGDNQTFVVKYRATPGYAYPAGTYAVDIVYTVTQK